MKSRKLGWYGGKCDHLEADIEEENCEKGCLFTIRPGFYVTNLAHLCTVAQF